MFFQSRCDMLECQAKSATLLVSKTNTDKGIPWQSSSQGSVSTAGGMGLIPGWGAKMLQIVWCGQKTNNNNNKNPNAN